MKEEDKKILNTFLKNTDELYASIQLWLNTLGLSINKEQTQINEEASGYYNIYKIIINDPEGKYLAELAPVGAWVIGADGRADLTGKYDKVILLYIDMEKKDRKNSNGQFYKGIEKSGWYWIEDRRRGKAHLLDKELFPELLSQVSDYEF